MSNKAFDVAGVLLRPGWLNIPWKRVAQHPQPVAIMQRRFGILRRREQSGVVSPSQQEICTLSVTVGWGMTVAVCGVPLYSVDMYSKPGSVTTLLEIDRQSNGDIPVSLVLAAYRASRSNVIMLVLNSVSPMEVDRLLDPVVATSGRSCCGVVYANIADDKGVLPVAATASRVFAASQDFRAKLSSRGIAFTDVGEAERALRGAEQAVA